MPPQASHGVNDCLFLQLNVHSSLRTGFREKAFGPLKFKVYGVAVYVDAASLSSLAAWKGKSAGDLQKDEAFYKAVAESE